MFPQSNDQSETDYLQQYLAPYPDVLGAEDLAAICGWKDVNTVSQKKCRLKKDALGRILQDQQGTLLPFVIVPPGGSKLIFTKKAVYDWLLAGGPSAGKRRGRPPGSKSRRGTGRAELEARI